MIDKSEYVIRLIKEAFADIDNRSIPLSAIVGKCIRISQLRDDYYNLWWLKTELINISKKGEAARIQREIAPHYTSEEFESIKRVIGGRYMKERETVNINDEGNVEDEKGIMAKSISEIEIDIEHYERLALGQTSPQGLHPFDQYYVDNNREDIRRLCLLIVHSCRSVLERIRDRVRDSLTQWEKEVVSGQINSDIFEKNRQYVDNKINTISIEMLEQLITSYRRAQENTSESRSHAVTSCRRFLKTLSDYLYPAREHPVKCFDGITRQLTKDKYISRLWQYVFEKVGDTASSKLVVSRIQDLGNRINALYGLACKGIHENISEYEVNQCVLQTYLLAGDSLRISEDSSAIKIADAEVDKSEA